MYRRLRAGWSVLLLVALLAGEARAQLRTALVAEGLSAPVALVPDPTAPATRFFIVERGGLVRVLDHGVLLPTPLIDLRPPVIRSGGEEGLLGMAFPPDAAVSGRFFLNFTSPAGDIVVARFRRQPATALTVDPATRFDLVWPGGTPYIPHPTHTNHNGGHLAFGPDGHLYIGTGDGGGGNDQEDNAQDPASLLGKMLRIDVNVADGHPTGYVVPPDNPFLDGQPVQALGEIWAFGLRNPWRYSFDDVGPGATGALIVADVGQGAREEVNYEPAGAGGRNYCWPQREGRIPTPGIPPSRQPAYGPLTDPVFDYTRDIGRAVTGGYVYRGSVLGPGYHGRYFVADFVTQRVGSVGLAVDPATGEAAVTTVLDHTGELAGTGSLGGIASFARDAGGELYLLTFTGRILKIVPDMAPGAPAGLAGTVAGRTVSLRWTPPTSGATPTGYRIEAGSAPNLADLAQLSTGVATGALVTGVPDGTYFVRVRATRNGQAGEPSGELRVVVAASCTAPPAAPGSVAAHVSGTTVTLSWAAAAAASGYVVEAGASPGARNLAVIGAGVATTLVIGAPSGTYYVRIRGENPCGQSAPSSDVVVTVP